MIINDDFDLKKIAESGQCFRVREFEDGTFRFVTGESIVYIRKSEAGVAVKYEISCDDDDWDKVWKNYFDLNRNYSDIRREIRSDEKYLKAAAECGRGIRILNQDPWEMLISFIISQRKSIPAIKTSIELLCREYGRRVETEYETLYLFPSAEAVFNSNNMSALENCKLGYRLKYIEDATKRVALKEMNLDELRDFDSNDLIAELKKVYGVGDKVANCIALFAYGRSELAPVDTWIKKVIDNEYDGVNPFPRYGKVAGIMQQYIFYYALTHKQEF